MQTTFIVEQETNDSSAQFPADQLERYLKTALVIRSFFLTTFLPDSLFPVPVSFLLTVLENMLSPTPERIFITYQHYIQNAWTYQKLRIQ